MKVSLDLVQQNDCNSSYFLPKNKRLAFGINSNSQICAGKIEGGKDTCQVQRHLNYIYYYTTYYYINYYTQ